MFLSLSLTLLKLLLVRFLMIHSFLLYVCFDALSPLKFENAELKNLGCYTLLKKISSFFLISIENIFLFEGKKQRVFTVTCQRILHNSAKNIYTHTRTICLFSREDGATTAPRWTATRIFSLFLFFSVSVEEVKEEQKRWRRRCAF